MMSVKDLFLIAVNCALLIAGIAGLFFFVPWISLIAVVVALVPLWMRGAYFDAVDANVFVPDPLKLDFKTLAERLASSLENAAIAKDVSKWILCPYCDDKGYVPYSIDWNARKRTINVSFRGGENHCVVMASLSPRVSLPVIVTDSPVCISFNSSNRRNTALLEWTVQKPRIFDIILRDTRQTLELKFWVIFLLLYFVAMHNTDFCSPMRLVAVGLVPFFAKIFCKH